jgi:hypothetical protein
VLSGEAPHGEVAHGSRPAVPNAGVVILWTGVQAPRSHSDSSPSVEPDGHPRGNLDERLQGSEKIRFQVHSEVSERTLTVVARETVLDSDETRR